MSKEGGKVVLGPGEGRTISTLGSTIGFKAVTEDTGGRYSLIEYTAGPEFTGPAPHIHLEMEEGFYVVEGLFQLQVGDEMVRAPAGTFVLIPRGTVHTFANLLPTPSKFLLIASPAGFEHYFEELAPLVEEHGYPPPEVMNGLAEKYNFRVVLPTSE